MQVKCEACHDEIPPYWPSRVYVQKVGPGEIPNVIPDWLLRENLSRDARLVADSEAVRTYLDQLGGLEGRQVPVNALLPRFERDSQFCGKFGIPGTRFALSIDNPNIKIPQSGERPGVAIVRLYTDRIDMGSSPNYGGTHIHSAGTIATIEIGRELPEHL